MDYSSVPLEQHTSNDLTDATAADKSKQQQQHGADDNGVPSADLDYDIDSSPPWYLCILLGFQHYLTMVGGMVAVPLLISSTFCFQGDWVSMGELYGTTFFVCGIATLLQTLFGCRLPIVQGASFAFLTAAMAILSLDKWKCPASIDGKAPTNGEGFALNTYVTSDVSVVDQTTAQGTFEQTTEQPWKSRMREIQGALITASLFEAVVGLTGLVGILVRVIGPLTVAPIISLVGLALVEVGADYSSSNWWISLLTIVDRIITTQDDAFRFRTMALITLFSRYLDRYDIPVLRREDGKWRRSGFPVMRLFPVILAVVVSWIVCAILTVTDAVPNDPSHWAYKTRTDTRTYVLTASEWFRMPYPLQWGLPTFSVVGFISMTVVVVVSVTESVADYYACARVAGAPPPPVHALNRGIFMEGIGCILSGVFGTGTGLTSFSENIGAISITRVGSRRVMVAGSVIMLILGVLGKFGAIFVTIPEPIIGGVFIVIFGVIAAVGVSNLQYVDMNSPRNIFIFGFSLMMGLALPGWLHRHPNAINTGVTVLDQILSVLGMTHMFVGGAVALFLDNTIPGTDKERGVRLWSGSDNDSSCHGNDDATVTSSEPASSTYDIPWLMPTLRRWSWTKFVPISPTFTGFPSIRDCRRVNGRGLPRSSVDRHKTTSGSDEQSRLNDDKQSFTA